MDNCSLVGLYRRSTGRSSAPADCAGRCETLVAGKDRADLSRYPAAPRRHCSRRHERLARAVVPQSQTHDSGIDSAGHRHGYRRTAVDPGYYRSDLIPRDGGCLYESALSPATVGLRPVASGMATHRLGLYASDTLDKAAS